MKIRKILIALVFTMPVITGIVGATETTISQKTIWDSNIEIKNQIRFTRSASLRITPNAKIIFSEKGQLLCECSVEADGAEFSANGELVGKHRIYFTGQSVSLKNCTFNNMISVKKKYHNAFMAIFRPSSVLSGNHFRNCSAIELIHCKNPVIKDNTFEKTYNTGLVIFHTRKALIKQNKFLGDEKTSVMLKLNNAENSRIISNRFFDNGRGIMFYGKSEENQVIANSFFRNTIGIDFSSSGRGKNMVLGCTFSNTKANAMLFRGGTDEFVRNCVFYKTGSCAVNIIKPINNIVIQQHISFTNNVIMAGKIGFNFKIKSINHKVTHNVFWQNDNNFSGIDEKTLIGKNIFADPMFVNPDDENFRLKSKEFGYESDSPLINSGIPEGTNIGLFP